MNEPVHCVQFVTTVWFYCRHHQLRPQYSTLFLMHRINVLNAISSCCNWSQCSKYPKEKFLDTANELNHSSVWSRPRAALLVQFGSMVRGTKLKSLKVRTKQGRCESARRETLHLYLYVCVFLHVRAHACGRPGSCDVSHPSLILVLMHQITPSELARPPRPPVQH